MELYLELIEDLELSETPKGEANYDKLVLHYEQVLEEFLIRE